MWLRVRDWRRRVWSAIRPGPEARKGAIWALLAAAVWAAVIGGINLRSGFGRAIDIAVAFAVALLGIPLLALIVVLLLTILRKLPRLATGIILGAGAFIAVQWPPPLGFIMGAIFALMEGILGATIATFLIGHFREAALSKKIITILLFVIAVAANVSLYVFLSSEGATSEIMRLKQADSPAPPSLSASNPADRGPYTVKFLLYGSGTDIRRPEYGKSVAIKTATLDASKFFKDFKG
ncbi:MAG: hypothetical protein ACR2NN_02745 [Bryobacteraceae bacterium]